MATINGYGARLDVSVVAAPLDAERNPDVTTARKFWRVRAKDNYGDGTYTSFNEIEMYAFSVSGENIAGGSLVSSYISSGEWSTSYPASEAFDGNTGTYGYVYNDTTDVYIGVEFTEPVALDLVHLYPGDYSTDSMPKNFAVEGSDDGEVWIEFYSGTVSQEIFDAGGGLVEIALTDNNGGTLGTSLPAYTCSATGLAGGYASGSLTLPSITLDAHGITQPPIELPAYTCSATGQSGGIGELNEELPAYTASGAGGGSNNATADIELPSYECSGGTGASGSLTLPSYEASGTGLRGNIGKLTEKLPAYTGEATGSTENVGTASITLPMPELSITGSQENRGAVDASLKAWVLSAQGYTGNVITGTLTLPAYEVDADGNTENIGSASIEIPLLIVEATGTGNESTLNNGYVLNLGNRAMTEYDSYPFNSMAEFNGVRLGANSNGIYALTGDTDAGAAIDSIAKFFFENDQQVRIRYAYVNYRSDDEITLVVVPEESTIEAYEYSIIKAPRDGLHRNRTKLGRGLKVSNGTIELRNNGGDFELDELEVVLDALNRKL